MSFEPPDILTVELPRVMRDFDTLLKPQTKGFMLAHSGVVRNSIPCILYRSRRCQLRIQVQRDRPYEEIEVYVSYGRLHAPVEKEVVDWQGEKCHCWHRLESSPLLCFLDGLTPTEADQQAGRLHPVFDAFRQFSINKGWDGPRYLAARHAFIWDHYGERFFELFDLHNTEIWQGYIRFLEAYSAVREERFRQINRVFPPHSPPLYKIC